jgi:hypothetical protein
MVRLEGMAGRAVKALGIKPGGADDGIVPLRDRLRGAG